MLESMRAPLSARQFAAVVFAVALITGTFTALTIASGTRSASPAVVPLISVSPSTTAAPPVAAAAAAEPETTPDTAALTRVIPVELSSGNATVVSSVADTSTLPLNWTRKTSSACQCSVEFPWAPVVTETPVESGTSQLILAERKGSTLSAALWTAPAASQAPSVDDLRLLLSTVASSEGTIEEHAVTARPDGTPVVNATLTDGPGVARVQVFAVGQVAYVMLMGASDGQLADDSFSRFTNSFTVL